MTTRLQTGLARATLAIGCLVLLLSWISPFDDHVATTVGIILVVLGVGAELVLKESVSEADGEVTAFNRH